MVMEIQKIMGTGHEHKRYNSGRFRYQLVNDPI